MGQTPLNDYKSHFKFKKIKDIYINQLEIYSVIKHNIFMVNIHPIDDLLFFIFNYDRNVLSILFIDSFEIFQFNAMDKKEKLMS